MSGTLLDLAKRMEAKAALVDKAASNLSVKIAQAIVLDLAHNTPVDTSQALSNWIVTLDVSANEKIEPHFRGEQGSTYSQSTAETYSRALKVLEVKKPGQRIFITNNLPYIRRLNEGYSKQQPAGFVERAVLIGSKLRSEGL